MSPPVPGARIAVAGRLYGTYGCLVETQDNIRAMLTAGHVLLTATSDVGDPVFLEAAGGRTEVGTLEAWVDPTMNPSSAKVDVAIARLSDPTGALPLIPGLGRPLAGRPPRLRIGDRVRMVGGTSGFRDGFIADLSYDAHLTQDLPRRPDHPVHYRHLVLCTRFTAIGDSGAAIVHESGHVVGIHVGGTSTGSFFCRIDEILAQLRVNLVT